MAITYETDEGTLEVPGSAVSIKALTGVQGLSTNGSITLVGEADGGPDYTYELAQEAGLEGNTFGGDQDSDVTAKYISGSLVAAYKAVVNPSNDTEITGGPSAIILVKTNPSTKASSTLNKTAGGTYGTLNDKNWGKPGNLINYTITSATAEVLPVAGPFTFLPPIAATDLSFRISGGSAVNLTATAGMLPSAFVTAADALSGVAASGGADRGIIGGVAGNLTVTVSTSQITISYSIPWTVTPVVGDTLFIPTGSAIQGGTYKNRGAFVVTSATASTVVATKLLDNAGSPGTVTNPEAVGSTAVAATTDVRSFAPVTLTLEAGAVVDGLGKSFEINELTTNTDRMSNLCYDLSATKVVWVSKTGAPYLLVSSAELRESLNLARLTSNISESIVAGGNVYMTVGYLGTTASLVISSTTFATTVTGGSGANLSISLADYPTISDLAAFVSSKTGYSAAPTTAVFGTKSPTILDEGTYGICTSTGNMTGRVKADAADLLNQIIANSTLVSFGTATPPVPAASGLPALVAAATYLTGGLKGSTTQATLQAAIDELEGVDTNFVVTLFSRDATSDIADGLTESSSTYQVDVLNKYLKDHCLAMSKLQKKKNRLAMVSKRATFAADKLAAANLNSPRAAMSFLDIKTNQGSTAIVQYQPWMEAVYAAGMQTAGFYKGFVYRRPNITGALMAAGDYNFKRESVEADALKSGLLPLKQDDQKQWIFVSDQTTWTTDKNFLYNSVQAMYVADVMAVSMAKSTQRAFVGKAIADMSQPMAQLVVESVLNSFLNLKLIAPSDDAPSGYKNLIVQVNAPAVLVSVELKLDSLIYFVPIKFLVSQVTQSSR